jgi:succinyl-CoA synthetase alpha subunit
MGHAGAIISGGKGTADEKIKTMKECGIKVAATPSVMGETLVEALKENDLYDRCVTNKAKA